MGINREIPKGKASDLARNSIIDSVIDQNVSAVVFSESF